MSAKRKTSEKSNFENFTWNFQIMFEFLLTPSSLLMVGITGESA